MTRLTWQAWKGAIRHYHRTTYITTPIYYVNAAPHIGHLHSSLIADTLRRYYALKGQDVFLCTGTDEHGLKIQQASANHGRDPQDFCDGVSLHFRDLCQAANIGYSTFIRTTEKRHGEAVKALWRTLVERGYIYKGKHEGWYAVSDEAFYANNQVHETTDEKTGEQVMVAIESGQRVEWTSEENYKFRLSAFQSRLLDWLHDSPSAIVPSTRRNEVKAWIENGLEDLSVSRLRSRLNWGIPVPDDLEHTIYVWLDALTNYLTATGYPETNTGHCWPPKVHVIGKDIVRFHAIYWPAFLMAAGLPLPEQVLAHAHWTMGKHKMSKSRGNVVDPFQLLDTYGQDPMRYYLMRDGGMADDGDFAESMIQRRYKKDLAGQLGNLLNRCTSTTINVSQSVPSFSDVNSIYDDDRILHEELTTLPARFEQAFEQREFHKGIVTVMETLSEANKHFTANEPWRLVKDPESQPRLDRVLYYAMESCRIAGILLQPVMPTKMAALLDRLGVPEHQRRIADSALRTDSRSLGPTSQILFPPLKTAS